MKAKHTEHLPFLYTPSASPTQPGKLAPRTKPLLHLANLLHSHKNNSSVLLFEEILHKASCISASHVYIEPEETVLRVRYRTAKDLSEEITPVEHLNFDINELLAVLSGSSIENPHLDAQSTLKASFGSEHYNLKIMPLFTAWGVTLTIALNKTARLAPMLDQLGIPHFSLKQLRDILRERSGLILIAGPKSSGKNLTQLAILQDLNSPNSKIISLEEHLSVQIPRISHLSTRNALDSNRDFFNYLLQQAPDIISIESISQHETLAPLLNASLNNTMLLASTHVATAIDAIEQLLNLGNNKYIVAQSLKAILTQQELPKTCPDCKGVHRLSPTEKKWVQQNFPGESIAEGSFTSGSGCDTCANTGLSGSYKIYELIRNSDELSEAIIEGSRDSLTTAISLRSNFRTLKQKAFSLANEGIIPLQQAMLIQ